MTPTSSAAAHPLNKFCTFHFLLLLYDCCTLSSLSFIVFLCVFKMLFVKILIMATTIPTAAAAKATIEIYTHQMFSYSLSNFMLQAQKENSNQIELIQQTDINICTQIGEKCLKQHYNTSKYSYSHTHTRARTQTNTMQNKYRMKTRGKNEMKK